MRDIALRLYHALPPVLQGWVASVHGARLMRLRYGAIFRRELPRWAERERWPVERWQEAQRTVLVGLLARAAARVPHYRDLHRAGRFPVERVRGPEDLHVLPVLAKEEVRARPLAFLADDCDPARMYREHTSGTTGSPLQLFWSDRVHQSWYACFERRVRNWNGVRLGEPWALLGGQLVVSHERRRPPYWVWNRPASQLYMSSYHLRPDALDAYLDELRRRRVRYLFGYASSLDALAAHALERGRGDVHVDLAISNAEPFFRHQRDRLERAFGCVTRDTYGPAELAVAAFECAAGRLHLSPDVGITEVLRDDGSPAAAGEVGDLVLTGLLNPDHVLIRYRIGDRGALAPPGETCACGRAMPILGTIEGRCDDVLVTADGRKIGRLDPVFKASLRVREAQIVQESLARVRIRVVPAAGYDDSDAAALRARLLDRMGDVTVDVECVDRIERTTGGKFRAVINAMPTGR